jgi:hypothetical protein
VRQKVYLPNSVKVLLRNIGAHRKLPLLEGVPLILARKPQTQGAPQKFGTFVIPRRFIPGHLRTTSIRRATVLHYTVPVVVCKSWHPRPTAAELAKTERQLLKLIDDNSQKRISTRNVVFQYLNKYRQALDWKALGVERLTDLVILFPSVRLQVDRNTSQRFFVRANTNV